jgi:hypothetical protein
MAHIREKRNAYRVSERKSECWRAVERLCVRRYRFRGVDKASAYLAARRPRGSRRPSYRILKFVVNSWGFYSILLTEGLFMTNGSHFAN